LPVFLFDLAPGCGYLWAVYLLSFIVLGEPAGRYSLTIAIGRPKSARPTTSPRRASRATPSPPFGTPAAAPAMAIQTDLRDLIKSTDTPALKVRQLHKNRT